MAVVSADMVTDPHSIAGTRIDLPKLPEETPPSLADTLSAAWEQNNSLSSFIARQEAVQGDEAAVPGFDALSSIADTGYAMQADKFIDAHSPNQVERIKRQIDQEQADQRTLHAAGWKGFAASLSAGMTDPVLLATLAVPGLGEEAAGSRAAAFGRQAIKGGLAEVPVEASLQATQATRTPGQGALNIAGATLLSGILGATLMRRIPKPEAAKLTDSFNQEFGPDLVVNPNPAEQSFGAAAAGERTTLAQETIAPGGETIAQTIGRPSPELRLMTSPAKSARELTQELSETPYLLNKNLEGIATPQAVETDLKRLMGSWWEAYRERGRLYQAYRQRAGAAGEPLLNRSRFNQEVSYAMRRGDESLIPEVAAAARKTRYFVIDPLKARAVKLGLLNLTDHVTGATSYLLRQYNVAKIRADQKGWLELLRRGFMNQGVESTEALDIAHQVTRNVLGSERGTLDLHALDGIVPKSGRLKERTLHLPDEHLEPFLVNDIDSLTQAYLKTLGPEVAMTERFGSRDMKEAIGRVTDEYAILKSQALAAGDEKAIQRLTAREERDLKDLGALRDRIYGTYGAPKDPGHFFVRAARFIRAENYMRLLGGQFISSFTDAARTLMIYGLPKMAASGVKLATSIKALGLARSEARRLGIGLDVVMNSRGVLLNDLGEASSFAEQRVMRRLSDAFSLASLQSPWNAALKSWASVMSQDDLLAAAQALARGGRVSRLMRARAASLGLDDAMLQRVAAQASVHGIEHRGLRFGQSDKWTDQEAARAFENAVVREADVAVITPGVGDLPRVHSSEWGKCLLQFKSFNLASSSRLLVPMLQGWRQGDVRMIAGTLAMFGTGSAVYILKQLTSDQPIEADPTRFAMEVVDKSGVLAWTGDLIFPALWQFGADDLSRWSDRQPIETLGGPVAGTIADAYMSRWPKRLADGDVSASDVHKLRRLIPGQNLFYLRHLVNELEGEIAPESPTAPTARH